MTESLTGLRIAGGAVGMAILLWAFFRFRRGAIARSEAFLLFLFSLCLLVVSAFPSSVNLAAQILAGADESLNERLKNYKENLAAAVAARNERLQSKLSELR